MANKRNMEPYWNGASWEVRIKKYNDAGNVIYTPVAGFKDKTQARHALEEYEAAFERHSKYRNTRLTADMSFTEYLTYYYEEVFRPMDGIENSTKMCGDYTIYDLILPRVETDLMVKCLNSDYLQEIIDSIAKESIHEANSARFFIKKALNYGVTNRFIANNAALFVKGYKRPAPNVHVLNKKQLKSFLEKAALSDWYFEILLALFVGCRKGEVLGIKSSDFSMDDHTVYIQRQITSNPERLEVNSGEGLRGRYQYKVIEKSPKKNSYRKLKCPEIIMVELKKRQQRIDEEKKQAGEEYQDGGYLSCQPNGVPHNVTSLNTELTKICEAANLPHITVHGLRHMYATILLEQNVALPKVSAMLGHKSVMTTFKYYADVIEGDMQIVNIINGLFPGGENSE